MAKISELADAGAIDGTEEVPVVKAGAIKKTTLGTLIDGLAQPFVDEAEVQAGLAATHAAASPAATGVGSADIATTAIGVSTPDTTNAVMTSSWSTGAAHAYDATITSVAVRFSNSATVTVSVVEPGTRQMLKAWTGIAVAAGVTTIGSAVFGDYVRPAGTLLFVTRTAGTGALRYTAGAGFSISSTTVAIVEGGTMNAFTGGANQVAIAETVKAAPKSLERRVKRLEGLLQTWGRTRTRTVGTLGIAATGNAVTTSTYLQLLSTDPCILDQFELAQIGGGVGLLEFWTDEADGYARRQAIWPVTVVDGNNTFVFPGGLPLPANCMVGYRALAGNGVRFQASVGFAFQIVNGTTAIGATAAVQAIVSRMAYKATLREPANRKAVYPPRTTGVVKVEEQTFPGVTTPNGWTLGAAFSISDGLISTGAGAPNNIAYFNPGGGQFCSVAKRLAVYELTITDPATIHGLVTYATGSGSRGVAIEVDCPAQKLRLRTWDGTASLGNYTVEAALPASTIAALNVAATCKLKARFTKDGPTLSMTVTDPVTQNSATVTETLSAGNEGELRLGHGAFGFVHRAGTTPKVSRAAFYHNVPQDVGTLILADSNGEGIYADVLPTWAGQAAAASPRVLVAARGGDTSALMLSRIRDLLAFKPSRVVIAMGTNDTVQATWRSNMEVGIDFAGIVGAEPIIATLIPKEGGQALIDSMNADILGNYFPGCRIVDFAAAVSLNNARTAWDNTYKKNANHVNAAGENRMYQQLLIDLPETLL